MATVIRREDESIDSLIKRFKKSVLKDGVMDDLKKRSYYVAPSLKKKLKSEKARKRDQKLQRKLEKKIDSSLDY